MHSEPKSGRALRLAGVAALGLSTAVAPVFAQSASDRETARSLMDRGEAATSRNDHAAALEAYRKADQIMKVPTTGLALARTLAALGQLVEARDVALRVTRIPANAGDPPVFARARSDAQQLADSLVSRIPSLTIKIEGGPDSGAKVTLDGSELPPSMLGVPKKIDPGKHVVVASGPGFEDARAEIDLAEGAAESVSLALEAGGSGPREPIGATPADEPGDGRGATSPLVYVGFGVGAAGIAVGSITGLMSLSKASSAKDQCDGNTCPMAAKDDADSSKTLANVSNIGFAVGLIGIGVGIYGLVSSGPSSEGAPAARARPVEPLIGARFVGVRGAF
jgi:hypothetical protein